MIIKIEIKDRDYKVAAGCLEKKVLLDTEQKKRELALTHKLNKKMTKQSRKDLETFVKVVNREIDFAALSFDPIVEDKDVNTFKRSMARLDVGSQRVYRIYVNPIYSKPGDLKTKYMTVVGYKIGFDNRVDDMTPDSFLEIIENDVANHYFKMRKDD